MAEVADQTVRRAHDRIGAAVADKWRLDQLLGVGGMAAVYAATHRNKKRVAIKMLHKKFSEDEDTRARFLREGYVANTVAHPGVVTIDDDGVHDDGCAYLVMELLQGETIEARWERNRRHLSLEESLALIDQLLDVLTAAHAKNVIHRDIKPENLFLCMDGRLKVLDFGIARLRDGGPSATATRSGFVMGTPAFMAPEQARGVWDEVDARSDLWAVGACLFTMVTGRYVHDATTPNEALARAITMPAPPVQDVLPGLPEPFVALVNRALAYEKGDRYGSAAEMQEALRHVYAATSGTEPVAPPVAPGGNDPVITIKEIPEDQLLLTSTPTTSRPVASASDRPERGQRPYWILAAIVAIVGTLGGLVVLLALRDPAPPLAPTESAAAAAAVTSAAAETDDDPGESASERADAAAEVMDGGVKAEADDRDAGDDEGSKPKISPTWMGFRPAASAKPASKDPYSRRR